MAKGPGHVIKLVEYVEDSGNDVPDAARVVLRTLVEALRFLSERIGLLDREIARRARDDNDVRRLTSIPGVGPITAIALAALSPPADVFKKGRDFAAWVGADALTALYRRQTEAWHDLQNGGANAAAALDHRGEFGGAQGTQAGH